jgi:hypothetical protein
MATWSDLKFKLIETGDETGTWGETTNANLGTAIEQAITGATDVTFANDNVTLVLTDTTDLQQGRALKLNLTGLVTASKYLQVPDIQKFYIISNELTENIVVKNSVGATYTIPAGTTAQVFSAGTGIENALTFFSGAILSPAAIIGGGTIDNVAIGLTTASTGNFTTLTLDNALAVAEGGTGVTTSTGTGNVVLSASPTLTGNPIAPTQTAGDNSTKVATTAYVNSAVTTATGSLGTMSTQNANAVAITGGTITGITDLAVADGGTGSSTLAANNVLLGNGTSALQTVAPSTSGNVLTSNGTTWASSTNLAIGVGQSWTDVKASRALGTTYTNSTGKPIQLSVTIGHPNGANSEVSISVNSVVIGTLADTYGANSPAFKMGVQHIIPNGATYAISIVQGSPTIFLWFELR